MKDDRYLLNFINIINTYINLSHWPSHFRTSLLIIIPKTNELTYNFSKIFHLIVFFNILGKLIEKIIGERLQRQSITLNFVHSNQLGRLKQCSTTDVGV